MLSNMQTIEHKILLKGGSVFTETGFLKRDVLLSEGKIQAVEKQIETDLDCEVFDISGCVVSPGFVDLHTHLRQPGDEISETLYSGSQAAAFGGYTSVTAMANTDPVTDDPATVLQLQAMAAPIPIKINIAASITKGRKGETLSPLAELAALGVKLFSDDGIGVQDGQLMRQALLYARNLNVILAQHSEDELYCEQGCVNEGEVSARLGLKGRPAMAEEIMLQRDLTLVRETSSRMHFMHLSSANSVSLLKAAKAAGLPVTGEVTPHHISLTESLIESFDTVYKVHPPLRTAQDVYALREAFCDDVIDVLATDHAPHGEERKEQPMDIASPGMLGLQTAFSVAYASICLATEPLRSKDSVGKVDWTNQSLQKSLLREISGSKEQKKIGPGESLQSAKASLSSLLTGIINKMSVVPAKILGLSDHGQYIKAGVAANLCVIDLGGNWELTKEKILSNSSNSPFTNIKLPGVIRHTFAYAIPVLVDTEVRF